MRAVGWLDLDAVVRCLSGLPAGQQVDMADAILRRADAADRYRKRFGRRHRIFGDGSLGAAAQGFPRCPPTNRLDRSDRQALSVVLDRIARRRVD